MLIEVTTFQARDPEYVSTSGATMLTFGDECLAVEWDWR